MEDNKGKLNKTKQELMRVGAIISSKNGVVEFLGYGVLISREEIPPAEIGGFNLGFPNPKIKLDNGDIVWGCECWWGEEEKFKKQLAGAKEIKVVTIADCRAKEAKADDHNESTVSE